jgi:GT2 family glycosyltransferase
MRTPAEVSIVLVNYNQREYTAQCLDSIRAAQIDLPYEVVLVDNASQGDDADWLESTYPDVRLVRSSRNLYIAGGNNLGIRASEGHYVLLLNNDTLLAKGSVESAARFLDGHPHVAGVGGNLLNADGSFQSGYFDFPSLWSEFLFVTRLGLLLDPLFPSHPPAAEACEVDWMSTAFMLFRRDALEQVGLVDEEYLIYSDETDLEYRLRKAGWALYYLPELTTIHFGGKSLTPWKRRRLLHRGKLLFFRKHYGLFRTTILRGLFAIMSFVKGLAWSLVALSPSRRARALAELGSHMEVVRLCFLME